MKIEYQNLYDEVFKAMKESEVRTKAPSFLNSDNEWELIYTFRNEISMYLVMLIAAGGEPTQKEIQFVTRMAGTRLNKLKVETLAKTEDFFGEGSFIKTVPVALLEIIDKKIVPVDKYIELYVRAGRDLIDLEVNKDRGKQIRYFHRYYRLLLRPIRRDFPEDMVVRCKNIMAMYGLRGISNDEAAPEDKQIDVNPVRKDSAHRKERNSGNNSKTTGLAGAGTKIAVTNTDIRAYRVKQLPYHFVLFHDIPTARFLMVKKALNAREDDNALLTYCYLDSMAGLSHKAICSARLSKDGTVDYNCSGNITSSLTLREGGLECPAELIDEDAEGMEVFHGKAQSIKKCYGYRKDAVSIRADVPFDEYRHPAYPDDIIVCFYSRDHKLEQMWVREKKRHENGVTGELLDEPFMKSLGLHKGDTVEVVAYESDGEVRPTAMLSWIHVDRQFGDASSVQGNNKTDLDDKEADDLDDNVLIVSGSADESSDSDDDMAETIRKSVTSMVDIMKGQSLYISLNVDGKKKGLEELIGIDFVKFALYIVAPSMDIDSKGLRFIRKCFGKGYTRKKVESMRAYVREKGVDNVGMLVPLVISADKLIGGDGRLSTLYLQGVSLFTIGVLQARGVLSTELLEYYKNGISCKKIIEDELGIELDYDPFGCVKLDHAEDIKAQIDVDEIYDYEENELLRSLRDRIKG